MILFGMPGGRIGQEPSRAAWRIPGNPTDVVAAMALFGSSGSGGLSMFSRRRLWERGLRIMVMRVEKAVWETAMSSQFHIRHRPLLALIDITCMTFHFKLQQQDTDGRDPEVSVALP